MGTNFYIKDDDIHIGKRSAAGWFCWDCGITLCMQGKEGIHKCKPENWHHVCPLCGNSKDAESITQSATGKELGLNKDEQKKTGVTTVCSFTWAFNILKHSLPDNVIVDEYGEEYSPEEFQKILKSYPIQYYSAIGQEFS